MNTLEIKKQLKMVDWPIIILLLIFMVASLAILVQTTAKPFDGTEEGWAGISEKLNFYYPRLQLVWYLSGFVWIAVMCAMNYNTLAKLSRWGILIFALLLVAVLFQKSIRGISGWFSVGDRGIQPAELTKLLLIVVMAKFASEQVDAHDRIRFDREFLKTTGIVGIFVGLVMMQPDTGTAMVYLAIFVGVLFAGRINWKVIVTVLLSVLIVFLLMFFTGLLPDYIVMRVLIFLGMDNPETMAIVNIPEAALELYDSAQQDTAAAAIASGGIYGKGFFQPGSLVQLNYLPEAHTDFIFASAVEATGFVGGLVIIILYALLIGRCMYLAFRARDSLGYFIIVGVICMQLAHIFENIGMNIGIMPITGIPLPFISYGGSNLWTNMMGMGLVLMVNMRRPQKRFSSHLAPESG